MAHRRVEKTRRDRMNMALIKLGSLIPNSFLKKVNKIFIYFLTFYLLFCEIIETLC